MLALGGQAALAQSAVPSSTDAISEHESASDPVNELGTITVIGVAAEEEKKIGNTTGPARRTSSGAVPAT